MENVNTLTRWSARYSNCDVSIDIRHGTPCLISMMSANGLTYIRIYVYTYIRMHVYTYACDVRASRVRPKVTSQRRAVSVYHSTSALMQVRILGTNKPVMWKCFHYGVKMIIAIYYVLVMLVIGKYAVLLHYYLLAILHTGKPALSHCSPACTLQLWCT